MQLAACKRGRSGGQRFAACQLHNPSYGSAINARVAQVLSTRSFLLLILAIAAMLFATAAAAEDGHDLWLRYRPVEQELRDRYAAHATAIVLEHPTATFERRLQRAPARSLRECSAKRSGYRTYRTARSS